MIFALNNADDQSSASPANAIMTLTSAGKVGIGTTSPSANLDIAGAGTAVTQLIWARGNNDAAFVSSLRTGDAGAGAAQSTIGVDYSTFTDFSRIKFHRASTTGEIHFYTGTAYANGTEKMRLMDSGNLGIGVTSPLSKLDVRTAGTGELGRFATGGSGPSYLLVGGGSSTTEGLRLTYDNSNGSSTINNYYNASLNFAANNTVGMTLTAPGNVGIGTTAPTTILTVRKAIDSAAYGSGTRMIDFKSYFAGYDTETVKSAIYSGVDNVGTLNTQSGYFAIQTALAGTLFERMRIDSAGNVGIGVTPSAWNSGIKALEFSAGALYSVNDTTLLNNAYQATSNSIYKASSVGASRFVQYNGAMHWDIAASGTAGANVTFTQAMTLDTAGSVGIGTTSPQRKLNVKGAGVMFANTAGDHSILFGDENYAYWNMYTPTSPTYFTFKYQDVEKMRLTSGAIMGLGVVPSAWGSAYNAIDINTGGAIYGTTNGISLTSNLFFNGTNWLTKTTDLGTLTASYGGQTLWYNTSSVTAGSIAPMTERMRLDASGNLGLGVAPSAWSGAIPNAFEIANSISLSAQNSALQGYLTSNAYYNGSSWIYKNTGISAQYYFGAIGHIWRTAPSGTAATAVTFTDAMALTVAGNLGIGTTAPIAKLEVGGSLVDTLAATYGGTIRVNSATQTTVQAVGGIEFPVATDGYGYKMQQLSASGANLAFASRGANAAWTERMRLDASGNVGIATASPAYKLDVSGNFRTTAVATLGSAVAQGAANTTVLTANTTLLLSGVGGNYLAFGQHNVGQAQWIQSAYINPTTATYPIALQPLGGLVGIGTYGPTQRLHVVGNILAAASGDTYIASSKSGVTTSYLITDSSGANLAVDGAWPIRFTTNGTERARIDSGGNLLLTDGFVPTNTSRLVVRGFSSAGYGNTFAQANSTAQIISSEMDVNQWYPTLNITMVRQSLTTGKDGFGGIGFSTIDDSNSSGMFDAGRIAIVNESSGAVASPTAMAFYTQVGSVTATNAATERMRIDSQGKVGIGTNSPSFKLQVAGTDNNNAIQSYNTASGNAAIRIQANAAGLYLQGSGTVDPL